MEKKKIVCLFLFAVLIFVFSSCHPRHSSDIRPTMTKQEVVSLWGPTNLITYETINGTAFETWEYHFTTSGSICRITFAQDKVTTTECHPSARRYYSQLGIQPYSEPYYYPEFYYYPYPYFYGGYYPYYPPYPPPHRPPHPPHHPPLPPPSPPPHPHHGR